MPAYDLLASLRIWEQVHREGEGWEYFICASKTHTMPSMRTAIKSSPARRFAQAQTGPRLGGPNKAKKSLGPLGSASENVDVNMNVYVYVNVSADRPPGSYKARNCRDHLRYFRVSGGPTRDGQPTFANSLLRAGALSKWSIGWCEHPRLYYPRCISGPPVIEPCQARYVAADERGWGGAPGARHAILHLKS